MRTSLDSDEEHAIYWWGMGTKRFERVWFNIRPTMGYWRRSRQKVAVNFLSTSTSTPVWSRLLYMG